MDVPEDVRAEQDREGRLAAERLHEQLAEGTPPAQDDEDQRSAPVLESPSPDVEI